jgi:hypothetical protein
VDRPEATLPFVTAELGPGRSSARQFPARGELSSGATSDVAEQTGTCRKKGARWRGVRLPVQPVITGLPFVF